jgi:hypothetical protein
MERVMGMNVVEVQYENRKMKPNKMFLKSGGRGDKKIIEVVNMIKVHYVHVWKYHSETPLYN